MRLTSITLLWAGAIALGPAAAVAETWDERMFHYKGGALSHLRAPMDRRAGAGGAYWTAYWNPDGRINQPGFHISFWGSGMGCSGVQNGAVAVDRDAAARRPSSRKPRDGKPGSLFRDTYLQPAAASANLRLVPTAQGVAGCNASAQGARGASYAHVSEDPAHGGIGLYTHAGPGRDGEGPNFFQPYSAAGQLGGGANRHIQGSFVTFRFAPHLNPVKPWGGNAPAGDDRLRVAIRTQQRVARIMSGEVADGLVTQVKQEVAVNFANRHCLANRARGEICQISFLIHTALKQDRRSSRLDEATILLDPVQKGLPVIYGPLKEHSRATRLNDHKDARVWTSWGAATRSTPFDTTTFQAEISFPDFLAMLKAVALRQQSSDAASGRQAARVSGSLESVTDAQVAALFGWQFKSPGEWFLLNTHFAQEIYSANPQDRAYIGGSMTELYIVSLPQ